MRRGPRRYLSPPKPIAHPLTAPGVNVQQLAPGFMYLGEADSLIAAGLVLCEWLPGKPDCPNARSKATGGKTADDSRTSGRRTRPALPSRNSWGLCDPTATASRSRE